MTKLILLGVLMVATVGVSQAPPHHPQACARPGMKLKDHVGCDCVLVCLHGERIEHPKCKAYCDLSKCKCHPAPCCPDGHEGH